MNTAITLLKREFWEHKGGFFWTPVAIGGFLLVLIAITLMTGRIATHVSIAQHAYNFAELAQYFANQSAEEKHHKVQLALLALGMPIQIALFFVMVFYAAGSLFDERKDRSILFWRSLPVSDAKTVLAKFAAAMLLAPALALGLLFAVQLLWLLMMTTAAWGNDVSAWANVWEPAALWSLWPQLALLHGLHALWFAPVIAWLMLVSAYAKKSPLLMAVLVPVLLAWLETLALRSHWLFSRIGERFGGGVFQLFEGERRTSLLEDVSQAWGLLSSSGLWLGLMVAGAMLAGAIALRRRSGEV